MADCPDGRMDREKMKVMFKAIMPEGDAGEVFLDQLFRIFDKDVDGSIDFKLGRQVLRLVLEGKIKDEAKIELKSFQHGTVWQSSK
jgi:hypothetical protein